MSPAVAKDVTVEANGQTFAFEPAVATLKKGESTMLHFKVTAGAPHGLNVSALGIYNLVITQAGTNIAVKPMKAGRPLMVLSPRPPLLETPFSVFDEGVFTRNDAFFVRWHLSGIPTAIDTRTFRISVGGAVNRRLSLARRSAQTLRTGRDRGGQSVFGQ